MKKMKIVGALLCSICVLAASAVPAAADAMRVVTLGADLTEEQKNTMLRYFKVNSSEVQIMEVNNQEEKDLLGAFVPLEQIGNRTVSCAYVRPTQSGGIKVRTANLNWVTGNMIATTLSTSGVSNCEVVAACPFEVSGTGALAGILKAYESASGETLNETKKQIATEELVVTGELADDVGQKEATNVINQAKMEVIGNDIQNGDDIVNVVNNIVQENNVSLTDEQLDRIVSLLEQIAEQDYDYDEMQETLETVEQNVSDEALQEATPDAEADPDSIVSGLDESELGDDVTVSSTEEPELDDLTDIGSDEEWDLIETGEPSEDEPEGDGTEQLPDMAEEGETVIPEAGGEISAGAENLSEEARLLYEKAEKFCAGEYEGDAEALHSVLGEDVVASTTLDSETGAALSKKVLEEYLKILTEGTDDYIASDTDVYLTPELNLLDAQMQKLFGIVPDDTMTEDILANVSADDKYMLYNSTMNFFQKLYEDGSMDTYYEDPAAETAYEEPAAESYDETGDSYNDESAETYDEIPEGTYEEY